MKLRIYIDSRYNGYENRSGIFQNGELNKHILYFQGIYNSINNLKNSHYEYLFDEDYKWIPQPEENSGAPIVNIPNVITCDTNSHIEFDLLSPNLKNARTVDALVNTNFLNPNGLINSIDRYADEHRKADQTDKYGLKDDIEPYQW